MTGLLKNYNEAIKAYIEDACDQVKTGIFDSVVVKKTARNMFVSEQHALIKEDPERKGWEIADRTRYISKLWRELGDEEKAIYEEKAKNYVPPVKDRTENGTLNRYQMFQQEKRAEWKKEHPGEKMIGMGELGELWRALSEKKQAEWKVKADEYNAKLLAAREAAVAKAEEVEAVDGGGLVGVGKIVVPLGPVGGKKNGSGKKKDGGKKAGRKGKKK